MTEPTVPVPVSLIERIGRASQAEPDEQAIFELLNLLDQPTPTAEPKYTEASTAPMRMRVRGDGFVTSPAAPPNITDMAPGTVTAEELPPGPVAPNGHRWPCTRFYKSSTENDTCTCGGVAAPPSITDMAPGTTFLGSEYPRSTQRFTWDGTRVHPPVGPSMAAFRIDPSTIRDVTPPTESTK